MSSIVGELSSTWTAQWYQAANGTQRADAWAERLRYYRALSELLGELAARALQPHQQITPRGVITEVARRAHFAAHETLYKRFRADWEGPIERWARGDDAIRPRSALVAEAKIVSFWPHRDQVLRVAARPGVTLPEVGEAYLQALAGWADADGPLAACIPAGPPACVAEDMQALAALWLERAIHGRMIPAPRPGSRGTGQGSTRQDLLADRAGRLERLASDVVLHMIGDRAMTPAKAVESVRDAVGRLLADPSDPVFDGLLRSATQLCDRLAGQSPGAPPVTPQQARRLLATLTPLVTRLSQIEGQPGKR